MIFFLKRAIRDILDNKFLHMVTIITTALSILMVSLFGLFFLNINEVMSSWKDGVRIFAYVENDLGDREITNLKQQISNTYGVKSVTYISKADAFQSLKTRMKRQTALFDNLKTNPLPNTLEIRMIPATQSWEKIENLAKSVEQIPFVNDVEYGQKWLDKFINIFNLISISGIVMSSIFFIVTVFIIANTIRLALYSRRDEIEIMRLVGASDNFIKLPFYIEGIIQGGIGGMTGLLLLYIPYWVITTSLERNFSTYMINIHFFPVWAFLSILAGSMLVGLIGCHLSLKQYLNTP
ncbi:MAG: permease-like cell division protein FtsX [Proteobacteria bacterium]|nr:permease-like cell division protein FtsX [Pseudomonadota bacterium]